jgi:hypothetical protein
MPSAQEAREARRRKILARGSDRLAYIAGELPSISSASLPSPVAPTSSGDDVPVEPILRTGDAALIRLIDTTLPGKPQEPLKFASAESYHKASTGVIKSVHEQSRVLGEVQDFPELEEVENLNLNSLHVNKDVQSTCLDEKLTQHGTGSLKERLATSLLTWDGIAYSIDATENYRASGALLLALVSVVQRFVFGIDLESKFSGNRALPWPVALVIVTDISLVFGALLLGLMRTPCLITHVDVPEASTTQDRLSKISQMLDKLECCLQIGIVFSRQLEPCFLIAAFML